jgi:hypothetical protein
VFPGGLRVKTRTFGVAVVALMTISTLTAVAGVVYQAAAGQGAQTAPQVSASQVDHQLGDNVAVSAFKFVCPFH